MSQAADITPKQVVRFIFNVYRNFPGAMAVMFFTAIYWAVDFSMRPYLLKVILNRVGENNVSRLILPAVLYFAMYLGLNIIFRAYNYFIEVMMIPASRKTIADHGVARLLAHSHRYYQNQFAGSLSNKINDLVQFVPEILRSLMDRFFSHMLAFLFGIFTLCTVNLKYGIITSIWAIIVFVIARYGCKRILRLSDISSQFASLITGKLVDTFSNILAVRLFSRIKNEREKLSETFQEAVCAERKLQMTSFWLWTVLGFSFCALLAGSLYFLIIDRAQGLVSVGDFALVLTINIMISDFMWILTEETSGLSRSFGKVIQALRNIDFDAEIQDKPNAINFNITRGEIVFDNVSFNYEFSKNIFSNNSVTIHADEKVGLVGYSGAGKTTFVNLILRLFDVTSGKILIDGIDIRDITQDSLRNAISMIPQDPLLFHRSIKENICYGTESATDEAIIAATTRAHAHEFIKVLPNGYDTLVGERGVKLSGGQRQRIAIARAILKNSPILILDEATSQIDSVTERYIQQALSDLMKEKTTIVIAHRLSTLLRMDRILVFDQGQIVEQGSHFELLKTEGLYHQMWKTQIGGFLPDAASEDS